MPAEKLGIIVLASGNGSNLEAIMRSCETGQINAEVLAVICNKPGAYCLERAKNHRVPGHAVDHRDYGRKRVPKVPRQWIPAGEEMRILKTSRLGEDEETLIRRLAHEKAVSEIADRYSPGLIVMAGYMRKLTPWFPQHYYNQRFDLPGVMNIHPALSPSFPGAAGYDDALSYGVKWTGVTVHFVDAGEDTGPIIAQEAVPVMEDDTVKTLKERGLEAEHGIYPRAIRLYAERLLRIEGRKVRILKK